jgi:hypothetical protein
MDFLQFGRSAREQRAFGTHLIDRRGPNKEPVRQLRGLPLAPLDLLPKIANGSDGTPRRKSNVPARYTRAQSQWKGPVSFRLFLGTQEGANAA